MKKTILATVITLALALSVMLGLFITASAQTTTVKANLSLAENITINFTAENLPASAHTAVITMPNGSVIQKDVATAPTSGSAKVFSAEVPVKYYDTPVTLDIVDAEGVSVLEEPKTYSVKNYCDTYIANSAEYGTLFTDLISALQDYGAAAKTYFADRAADTATETLPTYSSEYAMQITGTTGSGIKHISASLILESETSLRHYFELQDGADIGDYTFYADLNNNRIVDPNEVLLPQINGDKYYVQIDGITPNDLDRMYDLVVLSEGNEYVCSYGAMTYAYRMGNNSATVGALKNLIAKMHAYWEEADKLRATVTLKSASGSTVGSFEYEYGVETPVVFENPPEVDGKAFIGWYEGGVKITSISPTSQGNRTLTATYQSNVIAEAGQDALKGLATGDYITAESVTDTTAVKFTVTKAGTYKSYEVNRYSFKASEGKRRFYDQAVSKGVRNVTFTMGLQQLDGYDTAPTTISIDGANVTNIFHVHTDGNVYLGEKANIGNSAYKIMSLSTDMKQLKINIDISAVTIDETTGKTVGKYTISAVNETGETVSATYPISDLNIRLAALAIANYDAPLTVNEGEQYGIIVDSPKFTYDTNSVNYVIPETATFPNGYEGTYSYGESAALATPQTPFEAALSTFNGYFFNSLTFDGWYLDENYTQPIASVPKNQAGPLLLYAKFTESTDQTKINEGVNEFKNEINTVTTDMGEIPDFGTAYTATIFPNTDHPRLYVNKDTLPTLRENVKHAESKECYDKIVEQALFILGTDGRLPESESEAEHNFDEDYAGGIESLAFLYLVTGNEYFGYAAISYSLNFLDTIYFPTQVHGSSEEYNDSNVSSGAATVLCEVYDWCYDLLTEKEKTQIIEGLCTKICPAFEIGCPPQFANSTDGNLGAITGHGTGTNVLRDYLSLAIVTYDENNAEGSAYYKMYHSLMGSIEKNYVPAPQWYYPSGANFQGSAYGHNKSYCHLLSEMLVKTMSGQSLYNSDDLFKGVTQTLLQQIRPDGEPIRMGDDYNGLGKQYKTYANLSRMALFGGSYYKIPAAKAWYIEWEKSNPEGIDWGKDKRLDMTPTVFLLVNDPNLASDDKYEDLTLVHYNGTPTGAMTVRSAWNDDNTAWMTFTNIDESYGANHDHMDAGTFQIYYKGMLALNSSAYQYDSKINGAYNSLMDSAYVKQTISKNGLLIYNPQYGTRYNSSGEYSWTIDANGNWVVTGNRWMYSGGQSTQGTRVQENNTLQEWFNKGTANQAKVLGYAYDETNGEVKYAYISGDITNAYDQATVDLVMRSTMTLATGNPDNPMAFIVYDRVISDDASFEKSFVLHTTNQPVFGANNVETVIPATDTAVNDRNWGGYTKVTGTNTFYYDNTLGVNGALEADDANDKYNGQLTAQTLLPAQDNLAYYYVGGDGKRFWLNGASVGNDSNIADFPVAEVGWGRVEITTVTPAKDDSFLNVMYVSDAGVAVTEQASLVTGATHEGAVTYGSCVMFSKTNTAFSGVVRFSTQGATEKDSLTYYVGGLAEGAWIVNVGGETQTVDVTKEGGIAVFDAPVGDVTLTFSNIQKSEITYEKKEGTFNEGYTAPTLVYEGDTVTLPTAENITREGYDFGGWYEDEDCTGTALTTVTYIEGGTTLYAKWTLKTASINYVKNGGTINGTYKNTVTYGTTTALPTDVTREGYDFGGWFDNVNCTGDSITSVGYSASGVTVYAKWTLKTAGITYHNDGGTLAANAPTSVGFFDTLSLPEITKDGFNLVGWYLEANFVNKVENITYTDGGVNLYAKWEEVIADSATVNYVLCGGHFNGAYEDVVAPNESLTLATNIEYEGYRFLGWYDNETCTGEAITSVDYADAQDGVITVYAKWEKTPSTNVGGEDSGIQLPSIKI